MKKIVATILIAVMVAPLIAQLTVQPGNGGGGGSGTVTSVSVTTANGVSGSVATATTTPAITLTLGAITPSSVTVSGLTASRAVVTDGIKLLASSAATATEVGYLSGVSSALQTQLDAKQTLDSDLTSLAALTAGGFPYQISAGSWSQIPTNNVVYQNDSKLTDSRAPSGSAGGDLTGTYPSPTLAAAGTSGTYTKVTTDAKGRVTSGTTLSAGDIPDLSATYQPLKGILTAIGGIGTGVAGNTNNFVFQNDSKLTDSRAPNGTAGGDLLGTYPNPTIATNKITYDWSIDLDGAGSAITTGNTRIRTIGENRTLYGWYVVCRPASSTISVDVWYTNNAIPTVTHTITGTQKPGVTNTLTSSNLVLTAWFTNLLAGGTVGINVDASTTATNATITLVYRK